MKRIVLLVLFFAAAGTAMAQMKDPVQWNFTVVKKSDKVYEVTATANIVSPWHIYSQNTPKGGPVPTKFIFKTNPLLTLTGKVNEAGSLKSVHDQYFGVDVNYYDNKVTFVQTINLKTKAKTNVSGTVEFMVCNDSQCLPPKRIPFDLKLQ